MRLICFAPTVSYLSFFADVAVAVGREQFEPDSREFADLLLQIQRQFRFMMWSYPSY